MDSLAKPVAGDLVLVPQHMGLPEKKQGRFLVFHFMKHSVGKLATIVTNLLHDAFKLNLVYTGTYSDLFSCTGSSLKISLEEMKNVSVLEDLQR